MEVRNLILQIFLIVSFCSYICDQFKVLQFALNHFLKNDKGCYCRCGGITNMQRMPRLRYGVNTYPSEFPWVATIFKKNEVLTTGSLINDRYVLTGASRIYRTPQSYLSVNLNKYNKSKDGKQQLMVGVLNIIFHPGFTSHIDVHDLALIRLTTNVGFQFPLVPICLPSPGVSYNGRLGVVVNYKTDGTEEGSFLFKIEIPVLPKKRCSESTYEFEDCLGIVGIDNLLCKNDAGAGVQYENPKGYYELIGVMTAKQSCDPFHLDATYATSPIPVMTTVRHYLGWIFDNTRDACYCVKY